MTGVLQAEGVASGFTIGSRQVAILVGRVPIGP